MSDLPTQHVSPAVGEFMSLSDGQRQELRATLPCLERDGRCRTHGGSWVLSCPTESVLDEVRRERGRQFARYGTNNDLADGTGPGVRWLEGTGPYADIATATELESFLRSAYERHEQRHGTPTWRHLVLEEVAEAFKEKAGSQALEDELIQVAALCVSWVETLRERRLAAATRAAATDRHRRIEAAVIAEHLTEEQP